MAATATTTANDMLFDRKIATAFEGLSSHYYGLFDKIPLKENALTLASYVISMKSEINPVKQLQDRCHRKNIQTFNLPW